MRRLFLFAGYDPDNCLKASEIYYVSALSKLGTVVYVADCAIPESSLALLNPCTAIRIAQKHNEYDFGSYKRAFALAESQLGLDAFDVVYMVNNSVFGPLRPLEDYLCRMESFEADAFGLVFNPHHGSEHLQSWFIGLKPAVYKTEWFAEFLDSVRPLGSKTSVCIEYETGFTNLLKANGASFRGLFEISGRKIYNSPLAVSREGLPFLKKSSFKRHGRSLGRQLATVLDSVPAELRNIIISEVAPGTLTRNPITPVFRYCKYLIGKLF